MRKMLIPSAIMFGILFLSWYWLTTSVTSEIEKEKNKYKVKIGQKFILEKDTLTIVDYSSIMETFTLSNGKEVNASLIFNSK